MRPIGEFVGKEINFVAEVSVIGDKNKPSVACIQNVDIECDGDQIAIDHVWLPRKENPGIVKVEDMIKPGHVINGRARVGIYIKHGGRKDYNIVDANVEGYE